MLLVTLSEPPLGAFLSGKSTAILPAAYYAELKLEAVVSRMPNKHPPSLFLSHHVLPASRQCQHGSNKGKYYACFDKAHEARHNNGMLACTLAMIYLLPAEHRSAPRSASSVQTAPRDSLPTRALNVLHVYARSARCAAARSSWFVTSHCGIHETQPNRPLDKHPPNTRRWSCRPRRRRLPSPRAATSASCRISVSLTAGSSRASRRADTAAPVAEQHRAGGAHLQHVRRLPRPTRHPIRHPNPFSYDSIQITSHSAFDAPAVNPNYLSVSYDADHHARGVLVLILVRYRNTHNKRTPPLPLRAVGRRPWAHRPTADEDRHRLGRDTDAPGRSAALRLRLCPLNTSALSTIGGSLKWGTGMSIVRRAGNMDQAPPCIWMRGRPSPTLSQEERDEALAVRNSACVPSPYCSAALYGTRNIAPCTLAGAPFRCDPNSPGQHRWAGPARPESRGLGPAWEGLGFYFLRPEPKPWGGAWPGPAWA
ncbi:hypothetical protein B0H14DRAFT_3886686 [Mycena olivaceomarginata]|nr:hypothetical protein B0H14DRAFT_3886686 [Mycena olivaceomarginata]